MCTRRVKKFMGRKNPSVPLCLLCDVLYPRHPVFVCVSFASVMAIHDCHWRIPWFPDRLWSGVQRGTHLSCGDLNAFHMMRTRQWLQRYLGSYWNLKTRFERGGRYVAPSRSRSTWPVEGSDYSPMTVWSPNRAAGGSALERLAKDINVVRAYRNPI